MENWLEKEAEGKSVLYYSGAFFMLIFIFVILSLGILHLFDIHVPPVPAAKEIFAQPLNSPTLFLILFFGALIEEILFRFPLSILVIFGFGHRLTLVGAVILSVLFGWSHGSISHIFIQGPFGFLLSILFLKCGGYQGNVVKALLTTTTVHAVFNGVLVVLAKAL